MIQIDYFQDTEDHIGTTGTVTLDGTPAEAFRKIAQDKIWPAYKTQFPMWDEVAGFKA